MKCWIQMAAGAVSAIVLQAGMAWGAVSYSGGAGGGKWVVIDKSQQMLRAYEGKRLVLESRVSTGREGKETPNGRFHAEAKFPMHRSRLYHNAPMPYSVQIAGNYFIHGFSSVPNRPASHGCIRLPLGGENPALKFYNWVDRGTPVMIVGKWGT